MSNVYFNSDLHLGHKKVLEFVDGFRAKCMGVHTIDEHDQMICDLWNDTVHKRDVIFILGDLGHKYDILKGLPGHKRLLLGNHDTDNIYDYLEVFDEVVGPVRYKRHWISHFPIHESELWGKPVIHGHTHSNGVADPRYINVSVELTRGKPIPYADILEGKFTTHNKVSRPFEEIIWE